MPSRASSTDPRSIRIQAKLKEAMLDLLRERRIESVSVSEIATRASVSRQVFYLHFTDRDDVAASAIIDKLRAAVLANEGDDPIRRVHTLVDVSMRYEPLVRNLRPSAASERLADIFHELLLEICEPIARTRGEQDGSAPLADDELEALTVFLAGGLREVIKFTVNSSRPSSPPASAERAHRMLDRCLEIPLA